MNLFRSFFSRLKFIKKCYQPCQSFQLRYCTIIMDQSKDIIGTDDKNLPADKNDLALMKPYILNLCKDYLFGIWKQINIDDFDIYRPNGGVSNYLFKCELTNPNLKLKSNEPSKIFVRIYGENHHKDVPNMIKDIVIQSTMSDFKFGPKLHAIFPSGRLEEFIEARPLHPSEMLVPEINSKIAAELAKFHSLEMPFAKVSYLFDCCEKNIKLGKENLSSIKLNEIESQKLNEIMKFDTWGEICKLWKIIESLNCLSFFCHNDCNVGNILKLNDKLMLIDYEYGNYNFRGYDIGNYFCEMMFNYEVTEEPYYVYDYSLFPSKEVQMKFIQDYLKNFKEVTKNKNIDPSAYDLDKLTREVDHCVLASHLHWITWCLKMACCSTINFDYLGYALLRRDAYYGHKKLLYPNGF